MKLISLYIENFGGLSHYQLHFEAGLTVVSQPNGFGKTTLAEFIRAMLYGFPRKGKTLEKSRRQKYAPWNGGVFGGNLVFEHAGRSFRLERTFGAAPKGDTFTLIDLATNRKSDAYSEDIGIELFGLDGDSFERSAYLPQAEQEGTLATASIQAKLTDLVEDSSDVGSFDKAIAALRAKRSALIPYRGSGGAAAETAGRISRLQMRLDAALEQQTQLTAAQEEAAQLEAELGVTQNDLAQLREALSAASEMAAIAAQQRQYAELQARCREVSAQAAHFQAQYPMGLPDSQELTAAEETADHLAVLTAQAVEAQPEGQEYLRESNRFEWRLPTRAELDAYRKKCGEYERLQANLQDAQFSAAAPEQEEHRNPEPAQSAVPIGTIAALTAGAAGIAGGALLMLLRAFLPGVIVLSIGAAAMLAGVLGLLHRKKQCVQALRAQRELLDRRRAEAQQELAALCQASECCGAEITAFLAEFGIEVPPRHFLAGLTELEHHVARYAQLQEQQAHREQQSAAMEAHRRTLREFFTRYGLQMEQDTRPQLRRLRADARDAQAAQFLSQSLTAQAETFRAEHEQALAVEIRQTADPEQIKLQEKQLRDAMTELTGRLLRQRQRVQELREKVSEIPLLREELERLQQKQAENRENARILDDTMAFLQQAREMLSTGYLGTIRTRFGDYLTQLEGSAGERYFIDADFQVQLERSGQVRELAYFSAGQADLVMLCMRFALVDALFKGQEVFVILDDPFVNLDDAHTAQALQLLRALSAQRQMLYLTCHSSRTL